MFPAQSGIRAAMIGDMAETRLMELKRDQEITQATMSGLMDRLEAVAVQMKDLQEQTCKNWEGVQLQLTAIVNEMQIQEENRGSKEQMSGGARGVSQRPTAELRSMLQDIGNPFPKLEFPDFDGSNLDDWVYKGEQYFELKQTSEPMKVRLASVRMYGKALRWHFTNIKNRGMVEMPTWAEYVEALTKRFGKAIFDDPIGRVKNLKQEGTNDNLYVLMEESDSCRRKELEMVELSEEIQISHVINELKEVYRRTLWLSKITHLLEVQSNAHEPHEQVDGGAGVTVGFSHGSAPLPNVRVHIGRDSLPAGSLGVPSHAPRKDEGGGNLQSKGDKRRLAQEEINEKKNMGWRLSCNEPYLRGHKCLRMQWYSTVLEPIYEQWDERNEINHYDEGDDEIPKVTWHIIDGEAELDLVRTMRHTKKVKKMTVHILVDSRTIWNLQWGHLSFIGIINIVQSQDVDQSPKEAVKTLNRIRYVASILWELSKEFEIDRFLASFVGALIELNFTDASCRPTLVSLIETVLIGNAWDRLIFKILLYCIKLSQKASDTALQESGEWAKNTSVVITKKYPSGLNSAARRFLQEPKFSSAHPEMLSGIVSKVLDSSQSLNRGFKWEKGNRTVVDKDENAVSLAFASDIVAHKGLTKDLLRSLKSLCAHKNLAVQRIPLMVVGNLGFCLDNRRIQVASEILRELLMHLTATPEPRVNKAVSRALATLGKNKHLRRATSGRRVPKQRLRRLAMGGSGIKGYATVQMLKEIEKGAGRLIHELVDLICGTSMGGIPAVVLCVKTMSLDQGEEIYKNLGKQVFAEPAPKNNEAASWTERLDRLYQEKHWTDREFAIGDWVYVKLLTYKQPAVVQRQNQKLAPVFLGPYKIRDRVGTVAYKRKLVERRNRATMKVLTVLSDSREEEATWDGRLYLICCRNLRDTLEDKCGFEGRNLMRGKRKKLIKGAEDEEVTIHAGVLEQKMQEG